MSLTPIHARSYIEGYSFNCNVFCAFTRVEKKFRDIQKGNHRRQAQI